MKYLSLIAIILCATSIRLGALEPKENLDRAIGTLFTIAIPVHTDQQKLEELCQLINQFHIGSVLIDRIGTIAQETNLINTILRLCPHKPLILQDLEWGLTMRLTDGIRFPHAMTCGAIQDEQLIYRMAQEIGREAKLLGVDINLAPVLCVNTNPRNPVIGDRSFGEYPDRVTQAAGTYLAGLQSQHVLGCLKHFPGHGDTSTDSHIVLPVVAHSLSRLQKVELYPYAHLIGKEVHCIMPAHVYVPALDERPNYSATMSKAIVTDLLRTQLGFEGVAITDALRMGALVNHFGTQTIVREAFNAGNDILLAPDNLEVAVKTLKDDVANKAIPADEVLRRAEKIKTLRRFTDADTKQPIDTATIAQQLHTPPAYALKKALYAAAITLVSNHNHTLPLKNFEHTAIITMGNKPENDFAVTLRSEHAQVPVFHIAMPPSGMEINELSDQLRDYNTLIIGIFDLNKRDYDHFGLSGDTIAFIRQLAQTKHVIVAIFGTPYALGFFANYPGVVMAYEDDPDAQIAAAHVITGALTPTGVLPIALPQLVAA